MKKLFLLTILTLMSATFFGCGSDGTEVTISINTNNVDIDGTLKFDAAVIESSSIPTPPLATSSDTNSNVTYADINSRSEFSTTVDVLDEFGQSHPIFFFFFHTKEFQYEVRIYVSTSELRANGTDAPASVGNNTGEKAFVLKFNPDGTRVNVPEKGAPDFVGVIPWMNQSEPSSIQFNLSKFGLASSSNIAAIRVN